MSVREAIVRRLGGVTDAEVAAQIARVSKTHADALAETVVRMRIDVEAQIQAAVVQTKESLAQLGGADPGPGFRRISEQPDRDLPALTREREIELAYHLYKTNTLAGRMVELKRDFVVSDGFTITSPVQAVQDAIDEFWRDPVNQLDETFDQKVLELGLYGEQAYPVFVTPNMGKVRLGYLDPAQIDLVYADPENAALLVGIETKGTGGKRRRYPIIMAAEERVLLSPPAQRMRLSFTDNPCFFFTVNRVTNATRGSSDLLRVLDWLMAYEDWMFDRLEWFQQLSAFIWDVLLKGMNEDQIRGWLEKNPPPKPNSIRAHNENVEWSAVAPELKTYDVAAGSRLFRNHILSNDGWPEHWFGQANDVNRASAVEMGEPIVRSLTARQKQAVRMFRAEIRYALRRRVEAGSLVKLVTIGEGDTARQVPPWEAFEISAPEIASRDLTRLGGVIVQVTQALTLAQTNQWLSHDDAAGVFALVAGMFGREVTAAPAPAAPAGGPGSQDYTPEQLARLKQLFDGIKQQIGTLPPSGADGGAA